MTEISVEFLLRIPTESRTCPAILIAEIGVGTHIFLTGRRSGNVCPRLSVEDLKIFDSRYDNQRSLMHCRLNTILVGDA